MQRWRSPPERSITERLARWATVRSAAWGAMELAARPSPEEMEKRAKEAQERAASAPLVEMQMRFEDFRDEGGLRLPHRITKSVNDETTEEINLTKFKLNPALKPDHFVKK